jgi:deoxyhypusine synthase
MDLYAELVRNNMVDGIVATGATIVDMDFFEGLGHKHYQALEMPDDDTLRSLYIDRIYDTYIDEEAAAGLTDHTIGEIANTPGAAPYSSREFIREMGKYLVEHGKKDNSLVKLAYEHDVPIFCPAFVDSSAGFGLVKHQVDAMKAGQPYMMLDAIADFRELTEIKIKAGTTGLLMIGGGVPKNFIQDTVVCAEILGHEDVEVHKYAVQITVADVRDGACSSSTLQEAASWGKVNTGIEQMVFAEAGSVMPLLASDAYHRGALEGPREAPLGQAVRPAPRRATTPPHILAPFNRKREGAKPGEQVGDRARHRRQRRPTHSNQRRLAVRGRLKEAPTGKAHRNSRQSDRRRRRVRTWSPAQAPGRPLSRASRFAAQKAVSASMASSPSP